ATTRPEPPIDQPPTVEGIEPLGFMRSSAMSFFIAASYAALLGHASQENTTVSSPIACTARLKSVTLPSIKSSPQHSTLRVAPCSAKIDDIFGAMSRKGCLFPVFPGIT